MAVLDFPLSPNLGDQYNLGNSVWTWNGSKWVSGAGSLGYTGSSGFTGSRGDTGFTGSKGNDGVEGFTGSSGFTGSRGFTGSNAKVFTDPSPPPSPVDGETWWDAEDGKLYIYYDDGNTSQWVEASPATTGYTGSQGDLGFTGSTGFTGSAGNLNISNDTSTNATRYITFTDSTSGAINNINTSSSKLYFNPSTGQLNATEFNSLSDINFKEDLSRDINSIEILEKIIPYSFNWKDTGNKSYGIIAQELEKIMPELVHTSKDGLKTVSYIPLIAVLIDAIKKIREENDSI